MLLTGAPHTVSGPVKHGPASLPPQSGFTWQPTPFPSTTSSQDSMASSLNRSPLTAQKSSTAPSITGCTRNPLIKSGISLKRCPDGSDGTMVPTCFSLINQRPVGTGFLTAVSTPSQIQLTVNILLSTFTTTISIPMPTRSHVRPAARKVLLMVSSCQLVSSLPRTSGSEHSCCY